MAILKITQDITGQVGVVPQEIYIETNDTLAEVTTAGYLNQARSQGYNFSNRQIAHVYGIDFNNGTPGCLDFQVQTPANPATGSYTLVNMSSGGGNVDLPVIANHIATYVGTDGTIGDDAATAINGGNIQAGLSGTAGYLASFPATASKGSLRIAGVANTGNTVTTISNAAMGQASTISIPDPGTASAAFILSEGANQTIAGSLTVNGTNLSVGSSGDTCTLRLFPAVASKGSIQIYATENTGNTSVSITNAPMGQASVLGIPDPGTTFANFLLDTGSANIRSMQQWLGLDSILLAQGGTWTMTRLAQGNYALVHTVADDAGLIAFDITPLMRSTSSKGFRLNSINAVYSIAVGALDSQAITLDRITYVNNSPVSVTSVPLTGSLETNPQANPYSTPITVTTPAFLNTSNSKYVLELTVNNSSSSQYSLYGFNLLFSQTIA